MSYSPHQIQAYKQAAHTVSKTRQIVMLYDGMIRFLQQARQAIEEKRIEDRFHLLTKTASIVMGLQASLDFDQSQEVATTLYDYYTTVDARVMALHQSNSLEECDALVRDLKAMREVWNQLDVTASQSTGPIAQTTEHVSPADASAAASLMAQAMGSGYNAQGLVAPLMAGLMFTA